MRRTAIVGIGAMGCLFGGYLSPLTNVILYGHWAQQLEALQQRLTLITPEGRQQRVPLRATGDLRDIVAVDIALVLVKSFQTRQAARDIQALLSRDGVALTLQNGVGNVETLASVLGRERVIAGSTTHGATLVAPAIVRHAGRGAIILQKPEGPRSDLILEFAALLSDAGLPVSWTSTIEADLWEKVAVNAAINPITALVESPNGFLVSDRIARTIATNAAREAALVARASGYALEPDAVVEKTLAVAQSTGRNLSSMLQDLKKGRPTELEAITGEIIRSGQRTGIATPYNDALYTLLGLKMRGEAWTDGLRLLPPEIQPQFHELHWKGHDEDLPDAA